MQKSSELHSSQSLRQSCERIRAILAGVDAAADIMESRKIPVMEVDFQAGLQRSMKDLTRWSMGVQKALTEKLDTLGAFRAEQPARSPAKQRKAKP
jgi:hypothetical protein